MLGEQENDSLTAKEGKVHHRSFLYTPVGECTAHRTLLLPTEAMVNCMVWSRGRGDSSSAKPTLAS